MPGVLLKMQLCVSPFTTDACCLGMQTVAIFSSFLTWPSQLTQHATKESVSKMHQALKPVLHSEVHQTNQGGHWPARGGRTADQVGRTTACWPHTAAQCARDLPPLQTVCCQTLKQWFKHQSWSERNQSWSERNFLQGGSRLKHNNQLDHSFFFFSFSLFNILMLKGLISLWAV